jgi:hypothetical protein
MVQAIWKLLVFYDLLSNILVGCLSFQNIISPFWLRNNFFTLFSDGEWGVWSDYSACSCQPQIDIGSKSKTRTCNAPLEENGGDFCIPFENNAVDNSTGIQIETQTDVCPCPVSK